MKKHRNVLNLSVWVLPDLKKQWDKHRIKESRNPEKPMSWSEWLHGKISTALNIDQMPSNNGDNDNAYSLKAILQLFISNNGNRLYAQDIIRIVKEWSVKTKTCVETTDIEKKIVPHFFRAWATYTLQIGGLNPSIVDYIRGDVANSIRGFYFNQVLPFEVIKKDYLKAVPKFGI